MAMQKPVDKHTNLAHLLVYSIGPDGQALRDLAKFMHATESFFHPSNIGTWNFALARFLLGLGTIFAKRLHVRGSLVVCSACSSAIFRRRPSRRARRLRLGV
jgi:hypothetical protein